MLYAIVVVIVLILDQGMKYWTTLHLALNTDVKELIPGLIHLRNHHNTGSAFSMMGDWSGTRWLVLTVTVLFAVLVILALARKLITGRFGRWMALLVLAGALGNGIDRMLYGYVVDMLQFGFWQSFPVFNVADIFITVCGVLFCIYILVHKDPLSAPDGRAVHRGPGGSVTTRPAPRRAEKPASPAAAEKAEKPVRPIGQSAAPRRLAKKEESAAPRRFGLSTPSKREERPAKPAAPHRAAAPKAAAPTPAPPTGRVRHTMRQGENSPLEQIQRPVVTRESFLEMTKRKPGDDPFAEWTQPKAQPAKEAAQEVARAEPAPVVREVQPEAPVREVKPAAPVPAEPETVKAPEVEAKPEPVKEPSDAAAHTKADVNEDMEFSLEDILNEFRDS